MKGCFSANSAASAYLRLIINEETAMKLAHLFLAATISVGAAFASVAPAAAMPAERPAVTAQGDIIQVRDGWRRDRDRDDRDDGGWRDERDWRRSDWRDDRRHWRRWRAERWQERREWRDYDRGIPFWLYRG
ncbi:MULTISPECIES: hypothetical protein [Rhizobium]|nr:MULTISPECIES: hypothetical protein [Rhizobium]MDC7744053.1 hypothetical protein [Rhizobium sp. BC56]MDC9809456.1 hypothetical protein [Rhizobium sp. MC62]MDC9833230.1 hypothetical protein [Rhizobium sp. MJ37]WEA27034.1 hypothetical protein PO862_06805 [Rhizobium sp. MJ22]WEA61509.1 hypothetical protein PO860_06485 [Rhizobium sp. BJ04]